MTGSSLPSNSHSYIAIKSAPCPPRNLAVSFPPVLPLNSVPITMTSSPSHVPCGNLIAGTGLHPDVNNPGTGGGLSQLHPVSPHQAALRPYPPNRDTNTAHLPQGTFFC